jgi:hypothetical protein
MKMKRTLVLALAVFTLSWLASGAASPPDLLNRIQLRIMSIPVPPSKVQATELKNLIKADPPLQDAIVIEANMGGPPGPSDIPDLLEIAALFVTAAKSIEKSGTEDPDILAAVPSLWNYGDLVGEWLADLLQDLMPLLGPKDQEKLNAAMQKIGAQAQAARDRWGAGEWSAGLKGLEKILRSMAKLYEKYADK